MRHPTLPLCFLSLCLSTCLGLVSVLCSAISCKVHSTGRDSILRTAGGVVMDFYDVLERVLAILQQHKRVTYRALQRQFDLDESYLEDLKAEIIEARQLAVDEGGRILVWTGAAGTRQRRLCHCYRQRLSRLPRKIPLPTMLFPQPPMAPRRRNVGSSRCCFVIWWTRLRSPGNLTRKTTVRWCAPIKPPALP